MENKIKKFILSGEFLETKKKLQEFSYPKLENLLLKIGYDEQSLCAYSFVCFLLMQEETVQYHLLASTLLENAFCHLKGAYQSSLYHTRRAIELDPNDIDLRETLLFFNEIPEKVINDEEAIEIAKEILKKKPDSVPAKNVLSRYQVEQ